MVTTVHTVFIKVHKSAMISHRIWAKLINFVVR